MEFRNYLRRYQLVVASRIVLAFWGLFLLCGLLLSAFPDLESQEGVLEGVLAALGLLSMLVAVAIAVAATIGVHAHLPHEERGPLLFRFWVVPFAGAVYWLALRGPSSEV
jgi:hypothetical protein